MFWATDISREMLYLRLKLFFKVFARAFCVRKLGNKSAFSEGNMFRGSGLRAILKWASLASKKWTSGKKKFGLFVNLFRLHFLNRRKITTSHLKIKIGNVCWNVTHLCLVSHCLTHLPVLQWLSKNYLKHEEKFERKYSHCLHVNSDHFEDASINRPIFKYKLDYGSRFLHTFITFEIHNF